MFHAEKIHNAAAPIQFSMTVVETAQMPLGPEITVAAEPLSTRRPGELNLSGPQVFVGSVSALGALGLFLWAVIKLWLFEA